MARNERTSRPVASIASRLLRNPKHLNVDSVRWEALQQLSEWQGLLAQNVPVARQIFRKVLEGRLVFVPRYENEEHWYEFTGEGSLTKFFSAGRGTRRGAARA